MINNYFCQSSKSLFSEGGCFYVFSVKNLFVSVAAMEDSGNAKKTFRHLEVNSLNSVKIYSKTYAATFYPALKMFFFPFQHDSVATKQGK